MQKTPGAVASQLPARPNCKKVQFGVKIQEVYVGSSTECSSNTECRLIQVKQRAQNGIHRVKEIPEWISQTPVCERDCCCKRHLGHLPTRPDAHELWVTNGITKFWDTLTQSYLCKESECVHLGRVNFAM